jgi:hypothetical protein
VNIPRWQNEGVRNRFPGSGPRGAVRKGFLTPLTLVAALLLSAAARGEISARLTIETSSLFVYEPFTLLLEVDSDAPAETPEFPQLPDLAVTSIRRLPADAAQRKHSFQIELISERDGILTIPPFTVRAEGETARTSALRLRIRKPRAASEMSLEVNVEPVRLRVGQAATVTVTWSSAVSFTRCKQLQLEIPLLADPRCHVFPLEPAAAEAEQVGLPVNRIRVVAQAARRGDGRESLVFRYKLLPREPCVLRSAPARLLCALLEEEAAVGQSPDYFYNHFFEAAGEREAYEEVYLAAPVPELTVRDLAEAGRSSRFAGIVGPCSFHTSIAPHQLTVGQPALFTVHLAELAFARHLAGLPSAAFAGLRSEFQLSPEPIRDQATDQARSFTYVLRPLRAGITRVPAVVIETFDPDTDTYRTLRSEPLPLAVAAGPDGDSSLFAPRLDAASPLPLAGIRHNRLDERTMILLQHLLEFLGRFWWGLVPLPPLLWLALRPLARRWERCRRDPVYARAVTAWWRFRRTAWRDEEAAWRGYLADRLGLHAAALTADSVTAALRARQVDAALVAEARRRLEERDAADYGRRPAAPCGGTLHLVRRLHKATAGLALMLFCGLWLPPSAPAADDPDAWFTRAMQMRGERPDEAQPLFVEAALRFEAAERFLNAGNSWFFADEHGRALANYRAAERRSPWDRQVRESVALLRANRADAFPPPAAPVGVVAAAWNRYGTWAPVLRLGSFVLAYLLAWGVILTAQLTGWRVRRAVWGVLLVAVLTPLVSLAQSSLRPAEGVIIEDTVARLGPGYAYDPAFQQPLHEATEFLWLETRQGWVHVRLPDASEGWLPESACASVR